jgi:pyridoxine kinase
MDGQLRAACCAAGDLFTALLLAWMHRHPGDLKAALELAVAGLQVRLEWLAG